MLDPERVARARILVAGDAMLDRYWFGAVDRISPEAPVPIVRIEQVEERPGGAANVAMNVASLGAQCTLVSIVGADAEGESLGMLLEERAIESRLTVDVAGKTVTKLRMISQHQQLLRADFDARPGADAFADYMASYESALDDVDVVLVSDYGKGALQQVDRMIAQARERSVPVIVDPKGADFRRYAGATVITPNFHEFESVVGPVASDEELRSRAVALIRELGIDGLLITRGEKGMVLVEKEEQFFDYPPTAREVFDVSGAGDTVVAAFGIAQALALSDEWAVRLANTAAGIVVGKLGTATVSLDELDGVLSGPDPGEPA
jgi:D-beta-D-heptose 7-phosphate kinase/D-beta-D-heptose 1-phosphate adenosyltransferase